MNETHQHNDESTNQGKSIAHQRQEILGEECGVPARNSGDADWSDVPGDWIRINGCVFGDLPCCSKEKLSMLFNGKRRGSCRVCGAALDVEVI